MHNYKISTTKKEKVEMNEDKQELLKTITDPRQESKITHPLQNIIMITICAVICGADTWEDIADFGKTKKDWLKKFLVLPDNKTPSADTIARLFHILKVKEFEKYFLNWINAIIPKCKRDYVAIDGKTLRRSFDKDSKKAAIHMVSAWSSNNNCVLGQVKTKEKSNEITAIPELLKVLEIENSIVTIDAMGTQKKIATTIIENKADYILAVKGNQPKLESEIIDYFDNVKLESLSYHEERDTGHGRMEVRKYYISSDIDCISSKNEWANLSTIGMTESLRHVGGKNSIQKKYYIASIPPDVIAFAGATRRHWGIENSLHWCLDVGFREDECRIRKGFAAENMAVVRHIALNMLKNEKTSRRGIAGKRFNAALNNKYLEKVLNF